MPQIPMLSLKGRRSSSLACVYRFGVVLLAGIVLVAGGVSDSFLGWSRLLWAVEPPMVAPRRFVVPLTVGLGLFGFGWRVELVDGAASASPPSIPTPTIIEAPTDKVTVASAAQADRIRLVI